MTTTTDYLYSLNPAARAIAEKFESRVRGTRGAPQRRERFAAYASRFTARPTARWDTPSTPTPAERKRQRLEIWKKSQALRLADLAGQFFDEHGSTRGDYLTTSAIDFVPSWESYAAPYHDLGGEGLAVVTLTRKRVYASSSGWYPRETSTTYLVGRNEAGTYFAHPIPFCSYVRDAIEWIWSGREKKIIVRQGDIALIEGRGRNWESKLPAGHNVEGDQIVHETHPPIPVPKKGQTVIVGRRAHVRVSEATRD